MKDNPQERGEHTSASSAQADLLCAGRHQAQKGLPDIKDESAIHGTTIHSALASLDPSRLTIEQTEIFDACLKIEAKLVQQYFGEELPPKSAIRERRLWILWANGVSHSGQIDCAYRVGAKALIIEYKTLQGSVAESPLNLQLRDQVCLYYEECESVIEEVAVAVVQPLVTHSPAMTVYQLEDIKRARTEMHIRVLASNSDAAKRTPGEIQCKWCKAKSICREYQAWASSMVVSERSIIETPVQEWTPSMCSTYLGSRSIAKKWMELCDDAMLERLKSNPKAIPGYSLGKPRVTETIINPQAVFDSFSQKGGTLQQFMDCIKVGKTSLKEALASITKLKGKSLDEELKSVIGGNSESKESEPSIVKEKTT